MTVQSTNVYRASWLAWPTRLFCWPLSVVLYLTGLVWRAAGALFAGVAGVLFPQPDPDHGWPDGRKRFVGFARQGLRYLALQSDEFPPFHGRVRQEGETPGPWWEAKRRLKKSHVALASTLIFVLYIYVGVMAQAGVVAGDYKTKTKRAEFLSPGGSPGEDAPAEIQDRTYVLGTDQLGRDVFALMLRGATTALWIGLFAATLSSLIGMILGALAGFFGGWIDDLVVWGYTTLSAIPYLLLLIAFSYVFKNNADLTDWYKDTFLFTSWQISLGLFILILAIGLTSWVGTCRIVRAEFIKHRDRDYVLAGRAMGLPTRRIIFKHVLPNVFHMVIITFSLLFIGAIKSEVILSFLGLGLEPSEASWGNMISKGASELLRAETVWWQITAATAALFGLVLSVNLFADSLRDALDPRLRK